MSPTSTSARSSLTAKQLEAAEKRRTARRSRVPANAIEHDARTGDGSVYFTWQARNMPAVAVFLGRRTTREWAYSFPDQQRADERVKAWIEAHRLRLATEAELRKRHSLQLGQILYACWGYEQTNIQFYQVIAVRGAVVDLHELSKDRTPTGDMTAKVRPIVDSFVGAPLHSKRPNGHNTIAVNGHRLYPWDGQTLSETHYG